MLDIPEFEDLLILSKDSTRENSAALVSFIVEKLLLTAPKSALNNLNDLNTQI
jgi:hypothetical protein